MEDLKMNNIVLIGRLARDPELKFIPATGMAVTKFTLAVDKELFGERKQQAISQGKPTADFIGITVFGKQAENCANYLAKGSQAAVHGRISTGSYATKTGEKRYTTDVIADRIEFLNGSKKNKDEYSNPDTTFFDDLQAENNEDISS